MTRRRMPASTLMPSILPSISARPSSRRWRIRRMVRCLRSRAFMKFCSGVRTAANWSPDAKIVSFGCPDNSVRAIDAETGAQVLLQTSHSDWVIDTVFTHHGDQLVSVGRDMSAKLTEVATQRFIDNISSITPGALRGGLQRASRHPQRDEFLVGGADGVPQAYRIVRKVQRRIGDNALCIRKWPTMVGRIYGMAFAPDGK